MQNEEEEERKMNLISLILYYYIICIFITQKQNGTIEQPRTDACVVYVYVSQMVHKPNCKTDMVKLEPKIIYYLMNFVRNEETSGRQTESGVLDSCAGWRGCMLCCVHMLIGQMQFGKSSVSSGLNITSFVAVFKSIS